MKWLTFMDGYSNAQISNLLERASVIGYFKLRMSVYIEFCAYLLLYRKKMELVIESFEIRLVPVVIRNHAIIGIIEIC